MTAAEAATVEEWRQAVRGRWPFTEDDYKQLERVTYDEQTAARQKGREFGVPEFALRWCHNYDGLTDCGTHLWRGRMGLCQDDGDLFKLLRPQPGWRYVDRWASGPYRSVYLHRKHRLMLTYCEGDLSLTYAPDRAAFVRELRDARRFYANH